MEEKVKKPKIVMRKDHLEAQKQRKDFEDSMKPENPKYARCFKNFGNSRNFKTCYWRYGYCSKELPEFFYTPPIERAIQSDRILFMGNLEEKDNIEAILEGIKPYLKMQKALKNIRKGRRMGHDSDVTRLPVIKSIGIPPFKEDLDHTKIYSLIPTYTHFWDYFFDNYLMMDRISITGDEVDICKETIPFNRIPSLIVGTNHKNYRLHEGGLFSSKPEDVKFEATGRTFDLPARLEEIASQWKIPLRIIDSWSQKY